jgi:hypothetical protein
MYLLLTIALTAIFTSSYILTRLFFDNRGSALLILTSGLLYLLPMIAGALGILRPYPLIILALIALLISVITYLFQRRIYDRSIEFDLLRINYRARPMVMEVLLVIIPVIVSFSWILIFGVQSLRHKIALISIPPYPWDVVEYHFPHLVDAVQSGSLWTTVWAHFPMGCEMFHAWGFSYLRNAALASPTHLLLGVLLILFSCLLLQILCFQKRKTISGTEITAYLILTVMLLLLPPLWDMYFNHIGKNDIAMSAFIIAALYYLLHCVDNNSKYSTMLQDLLLFGISIGLASGIKPHGLLYSAFFLGMLLKNVYFKKVQLYLVGVAFLCMLLLSVFWYIRPLIMLGGIPPSGVTETVVYNLYRGLNLFIKGRENLLFSFSIVFCLIMMVVLHNKDYRMRIANYTLAASIGIFFFTPFSALLGTGMQLRLAPATIPLVIIISLSTFLQTIVKAGGEYSSFQLNEQNSQAYWRGTILAFAPIFLGSIAMVAVSFMGGLESKPRWAWNIRGLIILGFLGASLSIYNSITAIKDYKFNISRSLLYVVAFFMVIIALDFRILSYKQPDDLVGYNEKTAVYRFVYRNIKGKALYALGLRPYGLYGQEFSNKVVYGGLSDGSRLDSWLSLITQEKADYLIIGRDYVQYEGWYDYKPFPGDVAKILAMPDVFKLEWSDSHAMVFKIKPSFYFHSSPIN